jgi:hypothetical protein
MSFHYRFALFLDPDFAIRFVLLVCLALVAEEDSAFERGP